MAVADPRRHATATKSPQPPEPRSDQSADHIQVGLTVRGRSARCWSVAGCTGPAAGSRAAAVGAVPESWSGVVQRRSPGFVRPTTTVTAAAARPPVMSAIGADVSEAASPPRKSPISAPATPMTYSAAQTRPRRAGPSHCGAPGPRCRRRCPPRCRRPRWRTIPTRSSGRRWRDRWCRSRAGSGSAPTSAAERRRWPPAGRDRPATSRSTDLETSGSEAAERPGDAVAVSRGHIGPWRRREPAPSGLVRRHRIADVIGDAVLHRAPA